ncbi:MAG: dihydrolipoamide acetyltransferase family protein [Kiritimatiellia bacterium]|nr:2-oxo acid dehydrogenase subunit E2 [Lentisphaerota bacterium]
MAQTIIMPKLGQTVEESTIVKWHKQVGDSVAKGDILFEIETDKAVLEVESFFEGTLLAIIVKEGQTVPVTTPVGFVGTPGESLPELPPPPARKTPAAAPIPAAVPAPSRPAASAPAAPPPAQVPAAPAVPARRGVSPRARRLLKTLPLEASELAGTGPGGRVVERDVLDYMETSGYNALRLTPAARVLALRESINVLELDCGQRIGVEEIKAAVAEKPQPLSPMRQVIARRMLQSTSGIPHFFVTVSVDVTEVLAWRKDLKKSGGNCSLNACVLKAAALALREFPLVNSSTDGRSVRRRSRVNIGMAVAVPDGLVVPVIREADRLGLDELNRQAAQLAVRARDGKLAPEEMRGGTFTVSNMGMLDVENFTAIINPGESAILAVATVQQQPVARQGKVVVRSIMKITLSSDHRLVDGALAARFVNKVRSLLEDVALWKNMI